MDEYINREDVLKCLEYNTIQKPSANDIVFATLRVAREKVEKLPVAQEEALFSFWRDPDKDPPKVETEVLVLYRYNGYNGALRGRQCFLPGQRMELGRSP